MKGKNGAGRSQSRIKQQEPDDSFAFLYDTSTQILVSLSLKKNRTTAENFSSYRHEYAGVLWNVSYCACFGIFPVGSKRSLGVRDLYGGSFTGLTRARRVVSLSPINTEEELIHHLIMVGGQSLYWNTNQSIDVWNLCAHLAVAHAKR